LKVKTEKTLRHFLIPLELIVNDLKIPDDAILNRKIYLRSRPYAVGKS